jgi:hypothetical protein
MVVEEPLPLPATPVKLPGIPRVFPATTPATMASATSKVSKAIKK